MTRAARLAMIRNGHWRYLDSKGKPRPTPAPAPAKRPALSLVPAPHDEDDEVLPYGGDPMDGLCSPTVALRLVW